MKALVATSATLGIRRDVSRDCAEGELVWMPDPCPASKRDPDGPCDCGRTFSGMRSGRLTTGAVVRDISWLTKGNYAAALRACFDAHAWCTCCTRRPVKTVIDELTGIAAAIATGTVLERRLDALAFRVDLSDDVLRAIRQNTPG